MGLFDDDFAACDAMLAEVFGGKVSIHRGSLSTSDVTAEPVAMFYEVADSEGFLTTIQSRDFVIDVADYLFNATPVQPRAGDRIKESIAGTTHVYEAAPIGNKPVAEWEGSQKPQWRIHTKFVGTE